LIAFGVALSIFLANSLWYALIMRGFYENSAGSWMQVSRENPSIPIILLGMFVLAVLMTILYPKVQLGIQPPILADAVFGMLIGLIYVFPASLYYYGTTNFLAFGPMAMDIVWHSIEEGLAGVVLGLLYRRFADQRWSAHRLEVT
jgi:hypothetical protein